MNWRTSLFVFSTVCIFGMTLFSMGFIGKEILFFRELRSENDKQYLIDNHSKYVDSINVIMAWNVFIILFLPLIIWSTYSAGKTCNVVALILYIILIWFPRWVGCLVFLEGDKGLKALYISRMEAFEDTKACEYSLASCAIARSYL